MIVPIGVPLRLHLLRIGLFVSVGAALLLPLTRMDAQIEVQPAHARMKPRAKTISRGWPAPIHEPSRDPFARELPARPIAVSAIARAALTPGSTVAVLAVATGAAARALVTEDGATRVVSAGDRLDGILIASIGSAGIRLANGAFVGLAVQQ